jgi:pullulanase/glycogen debranching enzyme
MDFRSSPGGFIAMLEDFGCDDAAECAGFERKPRGVGDDGQGAFPEAFPEPLEVSQSEVDADDARIAQIREILHQPAATASEIADDIAWRESRTVQDGFLNTAGSVMIRARTRREIVEFLCIRAIMCVMVRYFHAPNLPPVPGGCKLPDVDGVSILRRCPAMQAARTRPLIKYRNTATPMHIEQARLVSATSLQLHLSGSADALQPSDIIIAPAVGVHELSTEGSLALVKTGVFDLSRSYSVLLRGSGIVRIDITPCLETLRSEAPLGCVVENEVYVFRLFAPRARSVQLHLYDDVTDELGSVYYLEKRDDGVWQLVLERPLAARWYAYSIDGPRETGEMFNARILVGDPYARAVATRNTFRHSARCLLPDGIPPYDWEDDAPVRVRPEDLVIYEMHVRDMTAHQHGDAPGIAGTYAALADTGTQGTVDYLRTLGVNAVELLPCQQFAWMEPPYLRHAGDQIYNDWNPYERNHWGYMTSFFFAPEPLYSRHADVTPGHWNDAAPRHIHEFKDMIKAMHRAGIAVIMDVVYNHSSQYDYQPLKYIDKKYYYRTSPSGAFLDSSGCGNDLNSRMPMMRRLIVDSVLFWMKEYHVDGFRFDLASIIDNDTFVEIRVRARALNPDVILIAEPWGADYDPAGFSDLGYGAWNDVFRNGVKGHDPMKGRGYLFGSWGTSVPEDFGKWILGSVRSKGGPFRTHAHSVNYLESHDGYTLGDFIRIATGTARPGQVIEDAAALLRLDDTQLRIARLAAAILFVSRGGIMIHAGQEFARAKIIADRGVPDVTPGVLDHNSYEKDDETNWLDFSQQEVNRALYDYYRGLIRLRSSLPLLRHAPEDAYTFLSPPTSLASGFHLSGSDGHGDVLVLINANHQEEASYDIPADVHWNVLAHATRAGRDVLGVHQGAQVRVPALSAMIMEAAAR